MRHCRCEVFGRRGLESCDTVLVPDRIHSSMCMRMADPVRGMIMLVFT